MTSDEEIQHLMTVPPKPELTRGDKIERFFGWLTAAIAVAGLTVAIIVGLSGAATAVQAKSAAQAARDAASAAQHAIDCINTTLSERGPLTAKDNAAALAFYAAQTADAKSFGVLLTDLLVSAPASKSGPDFIAYVKVHTAFINTANSTYETLQSSQKSRNAKPLGMC